MKILVFIHVIVVTETVEQVRVDVVDNGWCCQQKKQKNVNKPYLQLKPEEGDNGCYCLQLFCGEPVG